ncbi:galactokinase [Corynebacterium anserum]|uniref:Galactokinase n=1 Tax=Corynebacterium anserum TaxID=2684406 RepID=A0A7G7YM15_9CORY|nr:galactokinase [Corynebacterium anserum]MBC2681287.1 galactokinase [Corynebacterium anserum]QNH95535.1 galactokinase [Corynebacterium anserum]
MTENSRENVSRPEVGDTKGSPLGKQNATTDAPDSASVIVEPQWINTRSEEQGEADARALFEEEFGDTPAGVWSAPGRVNLIGEHVDYALGISIPFALTQRTYVAARLNGTDTYRVVSRYAPHTGEPAQNVRVEIPTGDVGVDDEGKGHPSHWAGYALGAIWAAREAGVIPPLSAPAVTEVDASAHTRTDSACATDTEGAPAEASGVVSERSAFSAGIDLAIVSDVPVGAGLSSSAALECSSALAAYDLCASTFAHGATAELSDEVRKGLMAASIRAENEVVGASTGGLDQRISLFGRAGHALAIDFLTDEATHVPFDIAASGKAILIINTNAPHQLNDGQYASRRAVIDGVTEHLGVRSLRQAEDAVARSAAWAEANVPGGVNATEAEVSAWTDTVAKRVRHVVTEIERTARAADMLRQGDLGAFGRAMCASHESLRDDYEVTVPELDLAVDTAMACGAIGARMTGGGFGGSAIALLDVALVEQTAQAIAQAFAQADFNAPEFVVATPSDGAHRH